MQIGTLYKADGTIQRMTPENGKNFSLRELQAAVGGFIELVRTGPGNGHVKMVINEEGKYLGLPHNARATALLHPEYADEIVGDCVVLSHE